MTKTKRMTAKWNLKTGSIRESHRKENGFYREYQIVDCSPKARKSDNYGNRIYAPSPVRCRLYWPGEVCYSCLWISTDAFWTAGSGSAGGYGYCKASAAIDSAIRSAGITLSESIHGVGDAAIREAMIALARMCKVTNFALIESHA